MKNITILIVLLSSQLFSNYAFDTKNTVKIDMHGGKNEKLTDTTKGFSKMKMNSFHGLQDISIKTSKESNNLKEKQNLELKNIKKNK